MKKIIIILVLSFITMSCSESQTQQSDILKPYVNALKENGEEPLQFILNKLNDYDLILFDDALHTAVEPFEFYQELINNVDFQEGVKYVFFEIFSVNQQPALDAYFDSEIHDIELLYPAFQNDFSGTGFPYKTYFDLLESIWEINSTLSPENKFKVIAVNAPTYWSEIHTPEDLELFRLSLSGNDYTMYKIILSYLENFESGEKGIFLTNTRHAYKGVKNRDKEYFLNCGTFFFQHNPGQTYSVRFHNINLSFTRRNDAAPNTPKTTEGLENVIVKWVRMENGLWDSAFRENGNAPIAFDLRNTPFGSTIYTGNHALNAALDQTMYDANDAIIFLAPLEKLHKTASIDHIYTQNFKEELERRLKILYTQEQLDKILEDTNAKSIIDYINGKYTYEPATLNPLNNMVGPIDEWRSAE